MVGGGPGSWVGEPHRIAMRVDDRFELVAGCFSRDAAKSRELGERLRLDPDRVYDDWASMIAAESERADGVEAVSVVTLPDTHSAVASACLDAGLHVVCEKPLTTSLEDARRLERRARECGVVFAVTHNYSGYPMVRQAASLVREGALGEIRVVHVQHAQGFGARPAEREGDAHLAWQADPAVSTEASVLYDLGTHAHHLLRFVTGLEVAEVAAELETHVTGRPIFDDAHVLLRLSNGARGSLWASAVAAGEEHGLQIRAYGEHGSLVWRHEESHRLWFRPVDGPEQMFSPGRDGLSDSARAASRMGLGHAEGFHEAFANLYSEIADAIEGRGQDNRLFPTVHDGAAGVRFVEAAAASHSNGGAWTAVG